MPRKARLIAPAILGASALLAAIPVPSAERMPPYVAGRPEPEDEILFCLHERAAVLLRDSLADLRSEAEVMAVVSAGKCDYGPVTHTPIQVVAQYRRARFDDASFQVIRSAYTADRGGATAHGTLYLITERPFIAR
ncbi:MAG: hypothetical protein AB7G39_11460 [Alphaproteobacteria bacterium]